MTSRDPIECRSCPIIFEASYLYTNTNTNTNHIYYIAPICGAAEALDDSQSGGIKQKRFQMFLKNKV